MRRRRVFVFVFTLVAFLGAAVLVWASRTERLTIFGDESTTLNEDVQVVSPVDLAKGIEAGDGNLTLTNGGIGLKPAARSGIAVFTLGQREIAAFYRVVPLLAQPLTGEGTIELFVSGSLDGVSFSAFSPAQRVHGGGTETANPIELQFLIPEGSHFVRLKVVLTAPESAPSPELAGFAVNLGRPQPTDASATIGLNGAPVNEPAGTLLPPAGRPATLVVTGLPLLPIGIFTAAGGLLWWVFDRRKGDHGRRTTARRR